MLIDILQAFWSQDHHPTQWFLSLLRKKLPSSVTIASDRLCVLYEDGELIRLSNAKLLRYIGKAAKAPRGTAFLWEVCLMHDVRGGEVDAVFRNVVEEKSGIRPEVTPFLLTSEGFVAEMSPAHVKGHAKLEDFQAREDILIEMSSSAEDEVVEAAKDEEEEAPPASSVDFATGAVDLGSVAPRSRSRFPALKKAKKRSPKIVSGIDTRCMRVLLPFQAVRKPLLHWLAAATGER